MFKALTNLFKNLFARPDPVLFSPQQALEDQRAGLIRAYCDREAGGLQTADYVECLAYSERTIGMVNNGQITLQSAYAQLYSFISRKRHKLAPMPALKPAALSVKGLHK